MTASSNYETIIYQLDEVRKTFRQYKNRKVTKSVSTIVLPEVIRLEKNNGYNTFSGHNNLLRFRDASNWSLCTKLGLKPVGISHFYFVDLFVENKKVLCLIYYPREAQIIELIIVREFYPCKKSELAEKIKGIVQSIMIINKYQSYSLSNILYKDVTTGLFKD
ncbi:hypothetical protein FE904_14950 [Chryseobacterium indologenes]|uniref:hypothetical protein n=1 Tax=Chryseobacterium indologenes TaxID=253 RepID=UPI001107C914|nr:hypothetical protein [Chryseobacterium indologenes]TLX24668.1 hypothetical protein FE904_14950 [Chryseobacterium indologenes]